MNIGSIAGIEHYGGVVQVETRVESAWFQRWKPRYVELLSGFAFNFNLRPYSRAAAAYTAPRRPR